MRLVGLRALALIRIDLRDGARFILLPSGRVVYQRDSSSQPIPLERHIKEQKACITIG